MKNLKWFSSKKEYSENKQFKGIYFSKDNNSFFESLFEANTDEDWFQKKKELKERVLEALEAYKEEEQVDSGVFNAIVSYIDQFFEKKGANFAYAWFNPEKEVRNQLEVKAKINWQAKPDKERMIRVRTGPFGLFGKKIEDSEKKKNFVSQYVVEHIDDKVLKYSILYIATSNEQAEYHHTERKLKIKKNLNRRSSHFLIF